MTRPLARVRYLASAAALLALALGACTSQYGIGSEGRSNRSAGSVNAGASNVNAPVAAGSGGSGTAVPLAPPVNTSSQTSSGEEADGATGNVRPPDDGKLPAVPPMGGAGAQDPDALPEDWVFVPEPYDPPELEYVPTGQTLLDPSSAVAFITESADFWKASRDDTNGGYHTFVDRAGVPSEGQTDKWLVGQSRNAYGFVRAFMVSGDETYLDYAQHALDFLYAHAWDDEQQGWFGWANAAGEALDRDGDKWSFNQHYALLGPATMCEATHSATDCDWLDRGIQHLDDRFFDHEHGGYFSYASRDSSRRYGKGFTPTADAVTTHALYAYLITGRDDYRARFLSLADDLADHLVASMDHEDWRWGFAEEFETDWSIGGPGRPSYGLVGHVFKAGWCLARAYLIEPDEKYRAAAQRVLDHMYADGGFDLEVGAPNFDFYWDQGLTGRSKEYWQVEQVITSGLINYYIAEDAQAQARYLEMGDRALDFMMTVLRDPEHGELFAVANDTGTEIIDGTKGGTWKAAYHSTETGYYAYLYGSLMYWRHPVSLYYRFAASEEERKIRLTPLAIEDDKLLISSVLLEGAEYVDFEPFNRTVTLPSGVGGVFQVTFNRY